MAKEKLTIQLYNPKILTYKVIDIVNNINSRGGNIKLLKRHGGVELCFSGEGGELQELEREVLKLKE